jgi:hypothetical protein
MTLCLTAADGGDGLGLGKMFADPNLLGKLATNPRTQKHLADPTFVQKVRRDFSVVQGGMYSLLSIHPDSNDTTKPKTC